MCMCQSYSLPRMSGFGSLGLAEWLVRPISAIGFKEPTPVQAHCIPPILAGKTVDTIHGCWCLVLQFILCFSSLNQCARNKCLVDVAL